jgi:hypothetical protein
LKKVHLQEKFEFGEWRNVRRGKTRKIEIALQRLLELWRQWHNHYHSCPRKTTHRENETKDPDPVMRKVISSNVFHNSIILKNQCG